MPFLRSGLLEYYRNHFLKQGLFFWLHVTNFRTGITILCKLKNYTRLKLKRTAFKTLHGKELPFYPTFFACHVKQKNITID